MNSPHNQITTVIGTLSAHVTVDGISFELVETNRNFFFDRDAVDGTWTIGMQRPEVARLDEQDHCAFGSGSIIVNDPATIAFVEALALLIAEPGAFRDTPVTRVFEGARP